MTDANQSDTPVSQEVREAADKALDIAFRGDTATIDADMAALFAAAEQRGRLAGMDEAAGIADDIVASIAQAKEFGFLSEELMYSKTASKIAQDIRAGARP